MTKVECRSTAEAESAIARGEVPVLIGDISLSVSVNCRIVCQLGIHEITTRGSSTANVESWGSSTANVESRESSTANVKAKAFCQLKLSGSLTVVAAATVAIVVLGGNPKIEGGGFIQRVDIGTPQKWCDYYGVDVRGGFALLGKIVGENHISTRNCRYPVGGTPAALDWDGGKAECGGGLHFSPTLEMAREFDFTGRHRLICPVLLSDMAVHPGGNYPQKCKARAVTSPLWEVDAHGEPVDEISRKIRDEFMAAHPLVATKKTSARRAAKKRRKSRCSS